MKSNKIFTVMVLLLIGVVSYAAWPINRTNVSNPRLLSELLRDRIGTLDDAVADLEVLSGGIYENIGTGSMFYVDSVTGADTDTGLTWALAKATIDAAVALCTDGNNDIIFVASGHEETLTADISLDIDDITVIGIGSGTDRPEVTLDTSTDQIVIDAANVTVYNISFKAGVTDVADCISFADESDGSAVIGCYFPEPANATHEFTAVFQLASGTQDITIAYNTVINIGATAGMVYVIDFAAAAVDKITIIGNTFTVEATTNLINSNQADTNLIIANNIFDQRDADKFCIQFTSTATGIMSNNLFCQLGGIAYILDPGSLQLDGNRASIAIDSPSFPWPVEPAEGRYHGTGNVFYVDASAANAGDGETWDTAFASLDDAMDSGICTANRGDVVYVAAGHTETLGSGGDGVDLDVAGVTVIGLGNGPDRPLFDYDTTTDEVVIGAAGVTIKNLTFKANVHNVAHAIQIDTAGDYASIIDCEFLDGELAGTDEFIDCIEIDTDATNTTVKNCKYTCTGTNANTFVDLTDTTPPRVSIIGCEIYGAFLEAPIYWGAAVPTQLYIADNTITNTDADQFCIEGSGNATGTCVRNTLKAGDLDTCLDPGYMACIENYASEYIAGGTDQPSVLVPIAKKEVGIAGNIWYVDSAAGTDAVTHGRSWQQPFAKIDYASAACTADNGDIIYVAPGHTEALTTTAMTLDEDGVTVIGLGNNSDRPTVTFAHGDSSIVISADDYTMVNLVFSSITAPTNETIDVTGPGVTLDGCTWIDCGTHENQICVTLDTLAARSTIKNCEFYSADTSGATSAISIVGGVIEHLVIENCRIFGSYSDAAVVSDQVNVDVLIKDCTVSNVATGVHAVEFTDATTGQMVNCTLYGDTPAAILDPGSLKCVHVFGSLGIDAPMFALPLIEIPDVPGDIFYVDADAGTDAATHGRSWVRPFDTVNYAVAACASDNGDVIYVAPGHVEAIAGTALTFNVDGIKIIGIGVKTDRPTFTFAHGDSSIVISADDLMMKNFVFSSITAPTNETIDVTGPGVVLDGCTWIDCGTHENQICITIDADAENPTIRNCEFYSADTSGATSCISIVAGIVDHLVIENCRIFGDFTDAAIVSNKVNTNCLIKDNIITNVESGVHCIEFSDAMTGELINNMLYADTPGSILDPGSMKCFGNMQSVGIDRAAIEIPLVAGRMYALTKVGALAQDDLLFGVTGGPILITSFTGLITTVIPASACTATIINNATTGLDVEFTDAVDIQSWVDGARIVFTEANPAVWTTLTIAAEQGSSQLMDPWFCDPGVIEMTDDDNNSGSGIIDWSMSFIPLADNVVVTVE